MATLSNEELDTTAIRKVRKKEENNMQICQEVYLPEINYKNDVIC